MPGVREDPPASPQAGTQLSAAPFTGTASGHGETASPSYKPEAANNPRAPQQTTPPSNKPEEPNNPRAPQQTADSRGPEEPPTTTTPEREETADSRGSEEPPTTTTPESDEAADSRGPEEAADASASTPEEDPPLRSTPALRVHLQGTFLLIVLLLVLWAALNWAGSVISSALGGPDGAVVAKAPVESDNSSDGGDGSAPDEPLEGDEVADLQAALTRFGYDPGPVDGILGELTRSAIQAAKADLSLPAASDRTLLETLAAAIEALDDAPTELGS